MPNPIQIAKNFNHGYTIYNFTANNTEYEVLTLDDQNFDVYSSRIGFAGRPKLKCYNSLDELSQRSKALNNFALLIK